MPVSFGRVGAHGRIARPCPTLFAPPTPVCICARPCCFISLEQGWWACCTPVLFSQSQPWPLDMGVSHTHSVLTDSSTATSHGHGNLSHPVLGKIFPCFHTVVSHGCVSARVISASEIWPMPVSFGRVGAHGRIARPCPTLFAPPTPVCICARPCCFISLEQGWWACCTPVLFSQSQPWPLDMGVSHTHSVLTDSSTATSHGHGNLSHPVLGKIFPCFHTVVSHGCVSARVISMA
ncbi:hypothetical protein GOBAR_AA33316 [Gossypium barbadense]|uniref:Uncharacterized protein n=1 Tax=Gossypium barbadense TaxID=3634 RepID=A0A2P5W8H1_GOSBA|nr:hypothetical protein GOBAR_AA33316 [Gossypium barbadense]